MFYLDAGNTNVKLARPTPTGWERIGTFHHNDVDALRDRLDDQATFGCSVVEAVTHALPQVAWLQRTDIPAARIRYATPETLGLDRFVACHGAWEYVGGAAIVIDAGTAVTIDLIDASGVFLGGVITPGLGILESALRTHAPALPAVPRELSDTYPPQSTSDAVKAGLLETWTAGIIHHVRQLHAFVPEAKVIVTGADATLLSAMGEIRPDLLFDGLRSISRSLFS
jgi:type III pantothenate kinase